MFSKTSCKSRTFKLAISLSIGLLTLSCQTALCQAAKMTSSQLTELVRSAGTRVTATSLTVVGTGPNVTVLAEKSSTASDRDLKVDAIFLSKTLIEGSSGEVELVKVLFSQPEKPGRYIMVDKKLVSDYASGKMTPEQLLASLSLRTLETEKAPDVAEGPLMERRLLVWQRIDKLKDQGTGVQAFQSLFQQLENAVKASESPEKLIQSVSFLENKLTEQEALVKQAKRAQQGHGIRAPKGGTSGSGSSAVTASTPPPSNSSSRQNVPWGQGGSGGGGGFPPGGFPGGGGPPSGGFPGGGPPGGGFPGGGPPGGGFPGGGPPGGPPP